MVNYEYAFYWSFYLDGSIGYEIKLTGELSTNLLSPGEDGPAPGWGTLVADRVNSQHHQHMFCARLDFAVDDEEGGKGLKVSEVSVAFRPQWLKSTLTFCHQQKKLLNPPSHSLSCDRSDGDITSMQIRVFCTRASPVTGPGLRKRSLPSGWHLTDLPDLTLRSTTFHRWRWRPWMTARPTPSATASWRWRRR